MIMQMNICPVCLNNTFIQGNILTERLIREWELTNTEIEYINKQQGFYCSKCQSNLRSMTLAHALMDYFSFKGSFEQFSYTSYAKRNSLLEINESGTLHSLLSRFKNYTFAEFPDVDIQKMSFADDSFDLIIHSDTLEHIPDSQIALHECFRVLKNEGVMFYTIPIVYGKTTRKRHDLANSYHGNQDETQGEDFKVWTEYGSDFWIELFNAGFRDVRIKSISDLSSFAIIAKKSGTAHGKVFDFHVFKNLMIKKLRKKVKKLITNNLYEINR